MSSGTLSEAEIKHAGMHVSLSDHHALNSAPQRVILTQPHACACRADGLTPSLRHIALPNTLPRILARQCPVRSLLTGSVSGGGLRHLHTAQGNGSLAVQLQHSSYDAKRSLRSAWQPAPCAQRVVARTGLARMRAPAGLALPWLGGTERLLRGRWLLRAPHAPVSASGLRWQAVATHMRQIVASVYVVGASVYAWYQQAVEVRYLACVAAVSWCTPPKLSPQKAHRSYQTGHAVPNRRARASW